MPGFDGTGPEGKGPRTGGGFGNCLPSQIIQPVTQVNPVRLGRGLGPCSRGFRGGRRGRGRR